MYIAQKYCLKRNYVTWRTHVKSKYNTKLHSFSRYLLDRCKLQPCGENLEFDSIMKTKKILKIKKNFIWNLFDFTFCYICFISVYRSPPKAKAMFIITNVLFFWFDFGKFSQFKKKISIFLPPSWELRHWCIVISNQIFCRYISICIWVFFFINFWIHPILFIYLYCTF